MPRLILASTSRYRHQLLSRFDIHFDAEPPGTDETPVPGEAPRDLVRRLAIEKAQAVAKRFPDAVVIGSDQIALVDDQITGKPGNYDTAVRQLQQSSGKRVELVTGLAVIDGPRGAIQSDVIPYSVQLRSLSQQEIESYVSKEQPFDCAGALKAEGLGIALVDRFMGDDPTAMIGLPLIRTAQMLKQAGIDPLD